jgi:hypothetical protein
MAAVRHPEILVAAASSERDLARQFVANLPRSLPPIPTFLAFVGLPQFADYFDVCQFVLPVSDWDLRPGDSA